MSRPVVVLLTLLLAAALAEGEGAPTTIGPLRTEPWSEIPEQAALHAERMELVARLGEKGADVEGSADALAEIVTDAYEEPGLRTAAADLLGSVTVEVTLPDGERGEEPRLLACALVEAVAAYDPSGWPRSYLVERSRVEPAGTALLVGLMVDERAAEFHLELAREERLAVKARAAAVCVIGALEGERSFDALVGLADDAGVDDEVRAAAVIALAPIGYDEGREFLEDLLESPGTPTMLVEAAREGLEIIDRTQRLTPGAWIMFAIGVLLLFGGSALFISIALRRGKKHVFTDSPDGGE
jgi:HEAT repeat protein